MRGDHGHRPRRTALTVDVRHHRPDPPRITACRGRACVGVVIIVLITLSPLALEFIADRRRVDWTRLGNVGQAYGAISAILSRTGRPGRGARTQESDQTSDLPCGRSDRRRVNGHGSLSSGPPSDARSETPVIYDSSRILREAALHTALVSANAVRNGGQTPRCSHGPFCRSFYFAEGLPDPALSAHTPSIQVTSTQPLDALLRMDLRQGGMGLAAICTFP